MKPCRIPKSFKLGSEFYSFSACSYDDGSSSVIAHHWHVRSIQNKPTQLNRAGTSLLSFARRAVFVGMASKKKGLTWVNGKWTKYIPKDYACRFELGQFLPEGIYTTELQAIKFAVKQWETDVKWYQGEIAKLDDPKEIAEYELELNDTVKELKLLKARHTRIQNRRNGCSKTKVKG